MSEQQGITFDFETAIIGAGFGGICMALRLQKAGKHNFVVLERAAEVGGTWRDNTYPGCACDIPSHLYSLSFHANPEWSRHFPPQPEILRYLQGCIKENGLESHLRLNTEVSAACFDTETNGWEIQLSSGEKIRARFCVLATGPLNRPNIPDLPGLDAFEGRYFHSSAWPADLDLAGKRIALIGTGASAIQITPAIAPAVRQLQLYQRTPPWVLPKPDRRITNFEKGLFKVFPPLQRFLREFIYWRLELFVNGFLGNERLNEIARKRAIQNIEKAIPDKELRERVTPAYRPGCKRILVSSDYYPALLRDNVELIDDGIGEIVADGIISKAGVRREADILVLATGFQASEIFSHVKITGLEGRSLDQEWNDEGPEALLGISVSGYPNLFVLLGPNTGLGHNSVVHMIESQVNYIMDYLTVLEDRGLAALDVKPERQKEFNHELQEKMNRTVWITGGCKSWYLTSRGKNTTLWPDTTVAYRKLTRKINPDDYTSISIQ